MDWYEQAACAGTDSRIFFPKAATSRGGITKAMYDKARSYCRACPVRDDCLAAALHEERFCDSKRGRYGMRGGMTPAQRERLAHGTLVARCKWCGSEYERRKGRLYCGPVCQAAAKAASHREWEKRSRDRTAERRAKEAAA